MQEVFKDVTINDQFLEQGYYVVSNLISKDSVKQLTDFYHTNAFESKKPFVSTNYSSNKTYRRKIFDALDEAIYPNIDHLLNDYHGVSGAMFVKKARQPSQVGLHIDWQMVDEPQHIGLNVWIPLVDTNRFNGCIKVVPGSHEKNLVLRGPNYDPPQIFLDNPISKKYQKSLYLKAGDALVFDNRLMHLSGKNHLFKDRLAISYLMVPKAAQPIHYYFEKEEGKLKSVRKYNVDRNFYIEDITFKNNAGYYSPSNGLSEEHEEVSTLNKERLKASIEFLKKKFS